MCVCVCVCVAVCKAYVLNWLGGSISLLSLYISSVMVCKASVLE